MRFRLLAGLLACKDSTGQLVTHKPGDILESDYDLASLHGKNKFERVADDEGYVVERVTEADLPPVQELMSFKRVADGDKVFYDIVRQDQAAAKAAAEVVPVNEMHGDDGFTPMTLAELKQWATANGVELGEARTKADILKVLREATAE